MQWSIRLGSIVGTEVKVHLTFLLLLGWYGLEAWRAGGPASALLSVGFLLGIFLCVLAHEFGHILAAKRFGIRTPEVLLWPLGGLAKLERLPERPREEIQVALAGPAVSLLIAVVLGLVSWGWYGPGALRLSQPSEAPFLAALAQTNALLLLFNLLPAFPMDGGRVLRALLVTRYGPAEGTRRAARVGQTLAVGMVIWGLFGSLPMLIFIGGFVFLAAENEARMVEARAAARGVTAAQMMVTKFRTIKVYTTLEQAAAMLLEGDQREFPVVDNDRRLEGILTRDDLIRGLASVGPGATVEQAMTRQPAKVPMEMPFMEALERLRQSGLPALPVVGPGGDLAGLLTWDNITDLLLVRRHLSQFTDGARPGSATA